MPLPAGTDQAVQVLGYHRPGDGGGGIFYWDAEATGPTQGWTQPESPAVVAEGTLVRPDATPSAPPGDASDAAVGRWRRLYSGALNVRWFGATGDGTSDDTAAFLTAAEVAQRAGQVLDFPPGTYRITRGYDVPRGFAYGDQARDAVRWVGGDWTTTAIVLDQPDPDSWFFRVTDGRPCGPTHFEHLSFRSNDPPSLRRSMVFDSKLCTHPVMEDVWFHTSDEFSVYFTKNAYARMNPTFRNVMFYNCGGIGTDGVADTQNTDKVIVRELTLMDVQHGGRAPDVPNGRKVVMDLLGCDKVFAENVIIEGYFPTDGWTVMRIGAPRGYTQPRPAGTVHNSTVALGTIQNFWSEWVTGGKQPEWVLDVEAGTLEVFGYRGSGPCRASVTAEVMISGVSSQGLPDFQLDGNSVVRFTGSTGARGAKRPTDFVVYRDGQFDSRVAAAAPATTGLPYGSVDCGILYSWDGGFIDGPLAVVPGSHRHEPTLDPDYGRAIEVYDASQLSSNQGGMFAVWLPATRLTELMGSVLRFSARVFVPKATDAEVGIQVLQENVSAQDVSIPTGAWSDVSLPYRVTNDSFPIQFRFSTPYTLASAGERVRVTALVLSQGMDGPTNLAVGHPPIIQVFANAAPTWGTWARGDRILNAKPTTAAPQGWVCTAEGSPGTWTPMAIL